MTEPKAPYSPPKTVEEWKKRWNDKLNEILYDPATHYFLKNALFLFMDKDPTDAANDAEFLAKFLSERADELLAAHEAESASRKT